MELNQLRYFLEVAQSQHMTRSAEQLHVAQSALSRAIHNLEIIHIETGEGTYISIRM